MNLYMTGIINYKIIGGSMHQTCFPADRVHTKSHFKMYFKQLWQDVKRCCNSFYGYIRVEIISNYPWLFGTETFEYERYF